MSPCSGSRAGKHKKGQHVFFGNPHPIRTVRNNGVREKTFKRGGRKLRKGVNLFRLPILKANNRKDRQMRGSGDAVSETLRGPLQQNHHRGGK